MSQLKIILLVVVAWLISVAIIGGLGVTILAQCQIPASPTNTPTMGKKLYQEAHHRACTQIMARVNQ